MSKNKHYREGSLQDKLGGYTSDHTVQSVTIELANGKDEAVMEPLRGATWNILKRGENSYNNPFYTKESDDDYRIRKMQQVEEIKNMLGIGQNPFQPPRDFIFLQEADFLSSREQARVGSGAKILAALFKDNLEKRGFKIADGGDGIVTIYNSNKLELQNQRTVLILSNQSPHNHGLECSFKLKNNLEMPVINLTNVHLPFRTTKEDIDRDKIAIYEYLKEEKTKGKATVIGGDTNNPRNELTIGDQNKVTNMGV